MSKLINGPYIVTGASGQLANQVTEALPARGINVRVGDFLQANNAALTGQG